LALGCPVNIVESVNFFDQAVPCDLL